MVSAHRERAAAVWMAVFVVVHVVAFFVVLALSPEGLDPCGPNGPAPASSGVQIAIAVVALLSAAIHAAWRVRGWFLLAAAGCLGVAGVFWLWVLFAGGDCGSPAAG